MDISPKPVRLISSVVLLLDVADNMVFRSFFYEFGWECGFWACAAYIIGIAQASVESQKSMSLSNKWLPSPRILDIAGFIFLIGPFATNSAVSLTAGMLATSNEKVANLCTQLLYIFWFFHTGGLAISVIYFGLRLIRLLNSHLRKFNTTSERYAEIKTGIFKIRSIIILLCIILYSFAFFLLWYGILRDRMLKNYVANIILCAFFNLSGPIAILFGTAAYFFTPKVEKVTLNGYETGQSSTVFEPQNDTKVIPAMNMTFQDTLTNRALDDLELKYNATLDKWNTEESFEEAVHKYDHQSYSNNPAEMYIDNQEYENFELQHNNSKVQLLSNTY
ncbi:hypothetical protein K501DRAFT_337546 [Backusella circina FSU 941]|nr:hypothetical protein K501DRAFT_337546 [Backusella circina FSU 941]